MTVAAVMICKDEADIIEATVRHLLANVDEVIVADNLSTDGTSEILAGIVNEGAALEVVADEERGHYQGRKMTALAMRALERGHRWALCCDADEVWLAPDGRLIRDWLDGLGREVQLVKAAIYNHVATALDPPAECAHDWSGQAIHDPSRARMCVRCGRVETRSEENEPWREAEPGRVEPNPVQRIRWRQRAPLEMRWGKVACRLRPDLEILDGNHGARTHGTGTTGYGLEIRHFPYRSPEQFVKKAVSGYAALRATDLDEGTGAHWRVYGRAIEEGGPEVGHEWFREHFWSADPEADDTLVYDPCPAHCT